MTTLQLKDLSLADFFRMQEETSSNPLEISAEVWNEIRLSREFLEQKIKQSERPIYGINTGFGELCREEIAENDLAQLQLNLVRSHACGVGRPVPVRISRMMLLLKIIGFRTGHSAASPELVQALLDLGHL